VSEVTKGRLVVDPIAAHPSTVTALCPLRRADGRIALASAGNASRGVPDSVRRDGTDALVITNEAAMVEIWDAVSGKRIGDSMFGHAATFHPVADVRPLVLPGDDGPVLVTGGNDCTLRRWDIPTAEPPAGRLPRRRLRVSPRSPPPDARAALNQLAAAVRAW
jgi:WD40 repeat protein